MINITDLEDRWLLLYKQRTSMIINRRQEDFKDQDREYPTSEFLLISLPIKIMKI